MRQGDEEKRKAGVIDERARIDQATGEDADVLHAGEIIDDIDKGLRNPAADDHDEKPC